MAQPLKSPRAAGDIQRKYEHQLNAIRASAKAFDAGEHWEAERISTAVQTLFHSGGQTVGLLDQLGLIGRMFVDSTEAWRPRNKLARCTLVSLAKYKKRSGWLAELDDRPMRFVTFDEWWNGPVLTDGADRGNTLSRRELVRVMRNQDGGSHVDPLVDTAYAGMLNSIGFINEHGEPMTADGEYFAMRQIGHEVLKSLLPTYRKRPSKNDLEAVSRSFIAEELSDKAPPEELSNYTETDPRDRCPCGSGKVYRACHQGGAQQPIILEVQTSEVIAPPGAASARLGFGWAPA